MLMRHFEALRESNIIIYCNILEYPQERIYASLYFRFPCNDDRLFLTYHDKYFLSVRKF